MALGYKEEGKGSTVHPPLSMGDMSQGPHWMPDNADSNEPSIYTIFSYTNIPLMKYNLLISLSKRLRIIINELHNYSNKL